MGKIEEIKKEIDNIDNMIKHLRQSTDGLWNYINDHISTTISMMMEIVEWAQHSKQWNRISDKYCSAADSEYE